MRYISSIYRVMKVQEEFCDVVFFFYNSNVCCIEILNVIGDFLCPPQGQFSCCDPKRGKCL